MKRKKSITHFVANKSSIAHIKSLKDVHIAHEEYVSRPTFGPTNANASQIKL